MTKLTREIAIACFTTILGVCSTVNVQAQVINSNEDFQLWCSKGAYYYKVHSPDCDRYIQENIKANENSKTNVVVNENNNQNTGVSVSNNLGEYLQQQEQQSWHQHGHQLFADAQDASADERYGIAMKLFESASEAFASAGDLENARIANRNALTLKSICRNYKNAMISHSINRLFVGTSVLGMVNDFQAGSDYRRTCRKK